MSRQKHRLDTHAKASVFFSESDVNFLFNFWKGRGPALNLWNRAMEQAAEELNKVEHPDPIAYAKEGRPWRSKSSLQWPGPRSMCSCAGQPS